MQELTFSTMIAVFEEIFGRGLLWVMVAAAVLVTAAYLYVLIRDRAVSWRKFLWAQVAMPFGAIAAVLFVQNVTSSGFGDIGGPIDVIVLLLVAVAGAGGAAVLVYTAQSLLRGQAAKPITRPSLFGPSARSAPHGRRWRIVRVARDGAGRKRVWKSCRNMPKRFMLCRRLSWISSTGLTAQRAMCCARSVRMTGASAGFLPCAPRIAPIRWRCRGCH